MSASYWRNQHNKHHATPQKLNHDVDLDTLPLVAFHKTVAEKVENLSLNYGYLIKLTFFFQLLLLLLFFFGNFIFTLDFPLELKIIKN